MEFSYKSNGFRKSIQILKMNRWGFVKWPLVIALYSIITRGKIANSKTSLGKVENMINGTTDSKTLSDTPAMPDRQGKPDWTTMYTSYTSNTTTPDVLFSVEQPTTLEEQVTTQEEKTTTKKKQVTTPHKQATTIVEQTTNKEGQATTAVEPATTKVEQTTTTVEQATTTVEQATTTVEQATTTIEQATTTVEQTTNKEGQAMTPQEQATTPLQQATTTVELATTTVKQATTSAELISTAVQRITSPLELATTTLKLPTTQRKEVTTSVEQVEEEDPCSYVGTCIATRAMDHTFCKCDKFCRIYNDCCFNFDNVQNISRFTPYINCYKGTSLANYEGFFAVGSCPDVNSNITEKVLCKEDNIIQNGPSVVGPDGMIFKNQYCALCHGINKVDVFQVTFYIPNPGTLNDVLRMTSNLTRTGKLEFMFGYTHYQEIAPVHVTPRTCIVSTRRGNDEQCQAYINPATIYPYFYRNYFCIPDSKRKKSICLGRNYDRIAVGVRWTALPVSVMFAFIKKETHNVGGTCDVWSQKLDEEGRCIEKERLSNFILSFTFIKLVANRPLPFHYLKLIVERFGLSQEIGNWIVLQDISYVGVANSSFILFQYIKFRIKTTMFEEEMRTLNERIENMQWKMHIADENLRYETIIIKDTVQKPYSKLESVTFDIYENETGIRPDTMTSGHKSKMTVTLHKNKKICNNIIVNVLINNVTETWLTCEDSSIVTNDTTFIKTIATYTCFSASVLALFLLIFLYRKLGLASSIPGSNLENISISLMLSKLLFMIGIGWSDIRELCYVIGVLLHYLWLSTFCFMSISVMCIVITLNKMQSNGNNRKESLNNKKRCLTLCGMVFPLLFVCPAILLDVFGDTYYNAGYGKEPCFPNHFPSNLMFFSGPVMFSISINFICLMKVICTIGRLSREIGHISMSTPFTNAKVYIRVLILSGLFWSIGILTALIDEEWIAFLFTILCGLQGFFISLASLTTKRVIRDLRQLKDSTVATSAST